MYLQLGHDSVQRSASAARDGIDNPFVSVAPGHVGRMLLAGCVGLWSVAREERALFRSSRFHRSFMGVARICSGCRHSLLATTEHGA